MGVKVLPRFRVKPNFSPIRSYSTVLSPCDTPATLPSLCLFPPPAPQPLTPAGLLLCQEKASMADLYAAKNNVLSLPQSRGVAPSKVQPRVGGGGGAEEGSVGQQAFQLSPAQPRSPSSPLGSPPTSRACGHKRRGLLGQTELSLGSQLGREAPSPPWQGHSRMGDLPVLTRVFTSKAELALSDHHGASPLPRSLLPSPVSSGHTASSMATTPTVNPESPFALPAPTMQVTSRSSLNTKIPT